MSFTAVVPLPQNISPEEEAEGSTDDAERLIESSTSLRRVTDLATQNRQSITKKYDSYSNAGTNLGPFAESLIVHILIDLRDPNTYATSLNCIEALTSCVAAFTECDRIPDTAPKDVPFEETFPSSSISSYTTLSHHNIFKPLTQPFYHSRCTWPDSSHPAQPARITFILL